VAGNRQIADAVAANLDQSLAYLTPRAQALTINRDYLGDEYFPVYQGETFYRLWQELSNVSAGIHGGQPAWFVRPIASTRKAVGQQNSSLSCLRLIAGLPPLEPAAPGQLACA